MKLMDIRWYAFNFNWFCETTLLQLLSLWFDFDKIILNHGNFIKYDRTMKKIQKHIFHGWFGTSSKAPSQNVDYMINKRRKIDMSVWMSHIISITTRLCKFHIFSKQLKTTNIRISPYTMYIFKNKKNTTIWFNCKDEINDLSWLYFANLEQQQQITLQIFYKDILHRNGSFLNEKI